MQDKLILFTIIIFQLILGSSNSFAQTNQLDDQGRKQGKWIKYQDGVKLYEGVFVDDHPQGEMLRYFKSGRLSSKSIFSDQAERCYAEFYYDERKPKLKAKGLYVNQIKDSLWQLYNDLGVLVAEERYDMGTPHGLWKLYDYNGALIRETIYNQGKIEGAQKEYFVEGGLKRLMNFESDTLNGIFQVYYPDGTLRLQGLFNHGLQDSIWVNYLVDGSVEFEEHYEDGFLLKRVDAKGEPYELPIEQDTIKIDKTPEEIMEIK